MQLLVLLDGTAGAEVLAGSATIVHSCSARLLAVRLDPASTAELTELPGVVAVTDRVLPDELAEQLNETEAHFAAAFAARGAKADRIGDGLSWDAPGFEPPDPPSTSGCRPDPTQGEMNDA